MTRHASRVSIVACLLLAGCHEAAPDEAVTETAVAVKVEPVTVGSIREQIAATGLVTAAPGAELTVTAPEGARIAALPKAEGDHVAAGEILARFDIPSLAASISASQAAIDQAAAHVENARAAATRLEGLVERGVAARKEAEDAQRDLRDAIAALGQAESARAAATALAARATVRAPFAGVIARRWHNPGDLVEPGLGDPIVRLVDPSRFEIVASVPVGAISRVPASAKAEVTDAGGATTDATVIARPVAIDPGNPTAPVRLKPASSHDLIAGVAVRVVIFGAEQPKAVRVPPAAIIRGAAATSVMVVDDESKAHRVEIETGITTDEAVEVVKGLKGGERVIVRGQNGLPDGAPVTVE
jgi:RND family efflux transporter MFP subunit